VKDAYLTNQKTYLEDVFLLFFFWFFTKKIAVLCVSDEKRVRRGDGGGTHTRTFTV